METREGKEAQERTNGNLPCPARRIGDSGAGGKVPVVRTAKSWWGMQVMFMVHVHVVAGFVLDVDGQWLAVVVWLGWDQHG